MVVRLPWVAWLVTPNTTTSADSLPESLRVRVSPGKTHTLQPIPAGYTLMNLLTFGLWFLALPHPFIMASYPVSVRQYRSLQSRLLQCMNYSIPPCGLLMLRIITPRIRDFHSLGFSPCEKKFIIRRSGRTPRLSIPVLDSSLQDSE